MTNDAHELMPKGAADSEAIFGAAPIGNLWNQTTDPPPPNQPKYFGYGSISIANYTFIDDAGPQYTFNYVEALGFFMEDYGSQSTQTFAAGENKGYPIMSFSSTNYKDPTNPKASLYAQFATHTCSYNPTEGGGGYSGYDFYANTLQQTAGAGYEVYFADMDYKDYGDCLIYSVQMPWPFSPPVFPRNMQYILVFQKSTGFIMERNNIGTEYCCPPAGTEPGTCVSEQLKCDDGSTPRKTWAVSADTYYRHQVYGDDGFIKSPIIKQQCPFNPAPGSTNTSPNSASTESADSDCLEKHRGLINGLLTGLFFAGLFSGMAIYIICGKLFPNKSTVELSSTVNPAGLAAKDEATPQRQL